MSAIVLSYHDCLLRERDLRTLDDGCWINDMVLSFAFEYLTHSQLTNHSNVLLVDPAVTQLLKLSDPNSATILLDSLAIRNAEWFFFTVNDSESRDSSGGSHWTLLVISPKLGLAFHLDPLYSRSNFDAAVRIAHQIAVYYEKSKLDNVVQLEVAKQQNACDCGLYCLVYAELLCQLIEDGQSDWQLRGLVSPEIHQLVSRKRSDLVKCIHALANSNK